MPVYEYACPACTDRKGQPFRHDYLFRQRTWEDGMLVDNGPTPPEHRPCPRCSLRSPRAVSAPKFRIARTNFYDESAGRTFSDESEMKQWCKDNGVSEDSGGGDEYWKKRWDAAMAEEQASIDGFNEYADRFDNDPDFADARRLRGMGYFLDKAKEKADAAGVSSTEYGGEIQDIVSTTHSP